MYEPTRKYLKEKSNIYHFAKRFKIIGYCNDATQAKEYLFKEKRENLSSLQKAFIEHQKDFCFACGIIKGFFQGSILARMPFYHLYQNAL